jgi:hypothetical protein
MVVPLFGIEEPLDLANRADALKKRNRILGLA